MSLQAQPTTPQAPTTPIEVSWDDALDGKFPTTRQQRLRQAVTQDAEQVFTQPAVQANPERLHKAMDLVLPGAVTLQPDGTATVKSGSHTLLQEIIDACEARTARRAAERESAQAAQAPRRRPSRPSPATRRKATAPFTRCRCI